MSRLRPHLFLLLLISLSMLVAQATAESAPLFCKCTCFKNSTLIQLGAQASCAQCTHAFCLDQNLPICRDVSVDPTSPGGSGSPPGDGNNKNPDSEVFSTCIQRDSRKDEIIVWGFILGTTGLLGWAAAKRIREARAATAAGRPRDMGPYAPVAGARR